MSQMVKPRRLTIRTQNRTRQEAVVLIVDEDTRLCNLVDRLVAHWQLPLSKSDGTFLSYTLQFLDPAAPALDCDYGTLFDLDISAETELILAAAEGKITLYQENELWVFDVAIRGSSQSVTALISAHATVYDLGERLTRFWDLPRSLKGTDVYYVPYPPSNAKDHLGETLKTTGLQNGMDLELIHAPGFPMWVDPEIAGKEDDIESEIFGMLPPLDADDLSVQIEDIEALSDLFASAIDQGLNAEIAGDDVEAQPVQGPLSGDWCFVSYSHRDKAFVKKLTRELKQAGVRTWRDEENIRPGTVWDMEIDKAIRTCRYVLFIASKDSIKSNNVWDEIGLAVNMGKTIIPILLLPPLELPLRVQRFQGIDFRDEDEYYYRLQDLLNTLGVGD